MLHIDKSRPYVSAFAPGRTELAGNHTDHQGGKVIAAAVECGIELAVQARDDKIACVNSPGFAPVELHVDDVAARAADRHATMGLVRGMVAGLRDAGVEVGGFSAEVKSDIPVGGGLSSSAAFELALGQALNVLFAGGALSSVELARMGQAAERDWFGKPCGLMDQLSVALGGANLIDFGRGGCAWEGLPADFEGAGYALALVDVHCDHSAYTDEYAQVAHDMQAVARHFGVAELGEVDRDAFMARFGEVRAALGDAAALRGLHYYHEMQLVEWRADALRCHDVNGFLAATRRSGASSAQYLQNVSTGDRTSQPAMVALALADALCGREGAVRIHGGGFGGTIQAFVPLELYASFARAMDGQLGAGSCRRYRVAAQGAHARWVR